MILTAQIIINSVVQLLMLADTDGLNVDEKIIIIGCADDPTMYELEEIGRFSDAEDDNTWTDMNNLDTYFQVSPITTTRIHKQSTSSLNQSLRDLQSSTQQDNEQKNLEEYGKSFYNSSYKKFRTLVELPNGKRAIGYTQEEGIDYDEVFAPIARIEAIICLQLYVDSALDPLWYPKDSPFDLVAYIDSDYAGASLDRKSTTGGYQFLGVD
ncbi:hypothetical protein Tco_0299992 [Tanacetum coccineum]